MVVDHSERHTRAEHTYAGIEGAVNEMQTNITSAQAAQTTIVSTTEHMSK